MGFRGNKNGNKNLSPLEKQVRFFTVICFVVIFLTTILIVWLVSR
ncbi:MAG TPA: hypothetical protein VGH42_10080 [Verrucomicrobiae bacterium]